jgi:mRNA interferase MazF
LTRGDVVLVVLPGDYGKPRPAIVVQTDLLNEVHGSTIVCLTTTYEREIPGVRIAVEPEEGTGMEKRSYIMADKLTTARRDKVRAIIGRLDAQTVAQLNRAPMTVLDLA